MSTRRAFLKTAAMTVAGGMIGWDEAARAAERKPLVVRAVNIINVRDRDGGPIDTYLAIASDGDLKGYAGPLLKEQVAAFPGNVQELLVGRDAEDPATLNFNTLWAVCHPGKVLESYREGKDPLTGDAVWGTLRTSRQTETGWVITALSAMDLAASW